MKLQPISVLRRRSRDLRRRGNAGGGDAAATSSATRLVMVSSRGEEGGWWGGRATDAAARPPRETSVEADLVLDAVFSGLDRVVDVVGARHHRRVQVAQDALDRGRLARRRVLGTRLVGREGELRQVVGGSALDAEVRLYDGVVEERGGDADGGERLGGVFTGGELEELLGRADLGLVDAGVDREAGRVAEGH